MSGMKKVRYAILTVALLSSGTYLFVYLYRWEWHRALVAGVLFVAAELGLAATAILDRLRSIESRLQGGAVATPASEDTLARLKDAAPEPRTNFEWLSRQRSGEMSVFVPLLLGAGVVLSAAAWLVERLARATAGPALERGLAGRLVPLSLPVGTFAGAPAPVARHRSVLPHVAIGIGAIAVATLGLDTMADATQNRPDVRRPGTASAVVVNIASRTPRTSLDATRALWGACTTQLGGGHKVVGMSDLGGGDVHVVVKPEIGKYAERRLRGCISDATTDKIAASVVSLRPVAG